MAINKVISGNSFKRFGAGFVHYAGGSGVSHQSQETILGSNNGYFDPTEQSRITDMVPVSWGLGAGVQADATGTRIFNAVNGQLGSVVITASGRGALISMNCSGANTGSGYVLQAGSTLQYGPDMKISSIWATAIPSGFSTITAQGLFNSCM